MKNKISKEKLWDYFILTSRFLLAITFFTYGYSKLRNGGQFGISEEEMLIPVKDISLFKLSWYLFDHEPFTTFIGISQIICGLLLVINRTVIIGAFLFLPIISTILIIDLTFMPPILATGFAWRLSFYIILDLLILLHYKDRMLSIWNAIWLKMNTKYRFKIWAYLFLPVFAIVLECIGLIPKILIELIRNPNEVFRSISNISDMLLGFLK